MKIVVLTGAGISAESGIATFRDSNGLWQGHDVMQVASPQGWAKNPALVLEFYNLRRAKVLQAQANAAHLALAALEQKYPQTQIITQNVDDLHERAGSKQVLHLHGEILKVRSSLNPDYILDWKQDLQLGDLCPQGGQLRPHIVWFGEDVPLIYQAVKEVQEADMLWIIGTSLQVYPAAGLLDLVSKNCPIYYLDAQAENNKPQNKNINIKQGPATQTLPELIRELGL